MSIWNRSLVSTERADEAVPCLQVVVGGEVAHADGDNVEGLAVGDGDGRREGEVDPAVADHVHFDGRERVGEAGAPVDADGCVVVVVADRGADEQIAARDGAALCGEVFLPVVTCGDVVTDSVRDCGAAEVSDERWCRDGGDRRGRRG